MITNHKCKTMSNRKEYISTFYNKNKVRFFLAILVLILYCFMQIIVANILQILTDVAAERDADKLIKFILYSGIYIFILIIVQTMYKNTRLPFIKKAIEQFKNKSFEEIINKNISTFSTENTSSYISALTNDLKTIEENYLLAIFNIYKNIVLIFGALLMMFYFEWSMTLVVVVLSFLPLLISNALSGNLTQKEKEVSIQNDNYVALIKDLLLGFYVIKSSIAETEILKLYQSKNRQLEDAKYRRRNAASVISIISSVVSFIAEVGVFLYGAYLAIEGKITAGVVIAFVQLMNYIIEPISELPSLIANKRAAIELIDKFIGIIKTNKINDGIYNINSIKDGITFNNVTFGFSDNVVLKNINIKFERGKSYAIIGESGSGKSTLLNLLLGSNDTYQGQILFDNIELRTIKRNCLYTIISIIQQNVFIFNSSIINNITMFKKIENINIDHAILHAGLIDVIKEKGNDYCCGENGINLSGGEKQRISIARSLIRKTSILLMDEATSALDIETSKNIENAILNIDGLTRIVVTHRLDKDILKLYDIIMVMQDGQIKEVGSFNELIQKQLFFYNMLNMSDNNTNYSI